MKATTFAVAAATLLTTVVADGWEQWQPESSEPVEAVTTTTGGYEAPQTSPVEAVTTTTTKDEGNGYTYPAPTTTPEAETTTSEQEPPKKPTDKQPPPPKDTQGPPPPKDTEKPAPPQDTSSEAPYQPSPAASSWSDWQQWSSTSAQPVAPTETTTTVLTSTVYSTITVLPNANTTTVTDTATATNAVTMTLNDQCVMQVMTSYGSPTWKPTPADNSPSASAPATWAQWAPSSSSSSAAPAPKPSGGNGGNGGKGMSSNGNKFGMTYSPYTSDGKCKDAGTVSNDIKKIKDLGFASVRVYSTDCDTLPHVGQACEDNGLKLILGVFISDTGINGAKPQVDEIIAWGKWELVELIVIGNEAVFQGHCSAGELAGFISSSASAFKAAGYNGYCTTTDELSVWQQYGSQWCGVIDVVSANLYAFFNPEVTAEMAGDFIQRQIDDLNKICPDKPSYVMESGWPSAANACNGVACASPENQATAIKGIQQTSGSKVVFFSFEDEQWKPDGQWGAEKHFGCSSVFEQ